MSYTAEDVRQVLDGICPRCKKHKATHKRVFQPTQEEKANIYERSISLSPIEHLVTYHFYECSACKYACVLQEAVPA